MRRIKIAQIGIGHDHCDIFRTLHELPEIFEVVGYHIPENEQGRFDHFLHFFEGSRELTLEEILEDPEIEAVVIETEEENLVKYATLAAHAGKHIHMDKPGGFKLEDFEALIELVRSKHLTLHLGYMYRYNPVIGKVLERAKNGEFGEIFHVDAQMNTYLPKEKRQWMQTLPGGMTFYLGCHLIDLLLQLQGIPKDIHSYTCSTGVEGVSGKDFSMFVFRYDNGSSVAKACCTEYGGFKRRQLTICGTKGTVEIKPMEIRPPEGGQFTDATEYYPKTAEEPIISYRSEKFTRYGKMMEAFGQMVRGEKENPYTYDYELALYKLVLRCCQM